MAKALGTGNHKIHCPSCRGKGWICDTTYDRSGTNVRCARCYGTGRSEDQIRRAVHRLYKPVPVPADT
jgi:DnaJ-class molecular chaperone